MSDNISISGIEKSIAALGYRNTRTLKYRLIHAVKHFYPSDQSLPAIDAINPDEIVSLIWEEITDPAQIRAKRKNLNSIKSSINSDLMDLFREGKNPEGIIIGPSYVFSMCDEAKDAFLRSITGALTSTDPITLDSISEVTKLFVEFLNKIPDKQSLNAVRSLLNKLGDKAGNDTESEDSDAQDGDEASETGIENLTEEDIAMLAELDEDDFDAIDEMDLDEEEDEEQDEIEEEPDVVEVLDVVEEEEEEELEDEESGVEDDEELPDLDELEELDEDELDESEDSEDEESLDNDDLEELEEIAEAEAGEEESDVVEVVDVVEEEEEPETPDEESGIEDDEELPDPDELEELDEDELDESEDSEDDESLEDDEDDLEEIEASEEGGEDEEVEVLDVLEDDEDDIEDVLEEIEDDDDDESIEVVDEDDLDKETEALEEVDIEDDLEEIEVDGDEDDEESVEVVDEDADEVEVLDMGGQFDLDEDEFGLEGLSDSERNRVLAERFDRYLGAMERHYNQFLLIPCDDYTIGSKAPVDNESPEQLIRLPDYYIGKFPVTNALFEVFVERTGYKTTAEKKGYGVVHQGRFQKTKDESTDQYRLAWHATQSLMEIDGACWYQPQGPGSTLHMKRNHPVVQVSLNDAIVFASWVGKRLPNETEWEAAARTAAGCCFPWGDDWKDDLCNVESTGLGDTAPVDQFQNGTNSMGISDLTGNVLEWVVNRSESEYHYAKGGSWISEEPVPLYGKFKYPADYTSNLIGFRCLAD